MKRIVIELEGVEIQVAINLDDINKLLWLLKKGAKIRNVA